MLFFSVKGRAGVFLAALWFLLTGLAYAFAAETATGPTLRLDYGAGAQGVNPVSDFMYFVPLISPEHVLLATNVGNTQCARVVSFTNRITSKSFSATCEFEFTGSGLQRDTFEHVVGIQRHEKQLKTTHLLAHQLSAITVDGVGSGIVEIQGTLIKGRYEVNEVKMRFNAHGRSSPVSINLQDIRLRDGAYVYENETVARVNSLLFRRSAGHPKMEVTLASLLHKDAPKSAWSSFVGELKGAAANMMLPPLNVEPEGEQAMLGFGLALVAERLGKAGAAHGGLQAQPRVALAVPPAEVPPGDRRVDHQPGLGAHRGGLEAGGEGAAVEAQRPGHRGQLCAARARLSPPHAHPRPASVHQ